MLDHFAWIVYFDDCLRCFLEMILGVTDDGWHDKANQYSWMVEGMELHGGH